MTPPSALSGPVPPLGIANFRHVTKCRGGSGGDLPSFLPVRCLMLKLVHPQISKPWECHLYFAQGCHLNFALTLGKAAHRQRPHQVGIGTQNGEVKKRSRTLSTGMWRISDKILLASVNYVTLLGRSPSYFVQWTDSELAPSAIRRMSVPPHQRPELKCYGQNPSSAAGVASYPTRRAGSRDCGCMVRG